MILFSMKLKTGIFLLDVVDKKPNIIKNIYEFFLNGYTII